MVTALYIASLSLFLSSPTTFSDLKSFKDAQTRIIGAPQAYASMLVQFGMSLKQYGDDYASAVQMLNDIDSGTIGAAVMTNSMAVYLTSVNCEFRVVGSIFVDQYLAFAFSPGMDLGVQKSFIETMQGITESLELQALIYRYLLVSDQEGCNNYLNLPLPPDLTVGALTVLGTAILMAMPLFFICRSEFLGLKITKEDMVVAVTTVGNEKRAVDFMNLMIKFECIMGSSKTRFMEKYLELKREVEESSRIQAKYEELIKKISFNIDHI